MDRLKSRIAADKFLFRARRVPVGNRLRPVGRPRSRIIVLGNYRVKIRHGFFVTATTNQRLAANATEGNITGDDCDSSFSVGQGLFHTIQASKPMPAADRLPHRRDRLQGISSAPPPPHQDAHQWGPKAHGKMVDFAVIFTLGSGVPGKVGQHWMSHKGKGVSFHPEVVKTTATRKPGILIYLCQPANSLQHRLTDIRARDRPTRACPRNATKRRLPGHRRVRCRSNSRLLTAHGLRLSQERRWCGMRSLP